MLSALVFVPIVGGILTLAVARRHLDLARPLGLFTAGITCLISFGLLARFRLGLPGVQEEVLLPWIPAIGVSYHTGVDGLSILLVVTTALMGLLAIIASWPLPVRRQGDYIGLILLLQGSVTGAFIALDLILFFAFWEAMLIPTYLIIGMLGGPRRIHAALKFFLYTAVGSLLMLVGILYLYFNHFNATGAPSFDLATLVATPVPPGAQGLVFLAFALAFAIKVPIFPLHTWLPDTYTQSPLPGLVLITMLVKVGAYGFLRFCLPLFPNATFGFAPALGLLGAIGILYGGALAVVQRDMIRLLAYSSIAHLGFVVLGIFSLDVRGVQGAILQMVNHSITAGALFLIAGMLLRRSETVDIDDMRGLAARYPVLAAYFLVSIFASLGLPGLNGFAGEILVIVGAWSAYPWYAMLGALGAILSSIYLLWWYRRVMNGHPERPDIKRADMTRREVLVLLPLAGLMFLIGLYPAPFLQTSEATVTRLLDATRRAALVEPVPRTLLHEFTPASITARSEEAGEQAWP